MITVMLDSNPFVRVTALNVSKAFDTVCHSTPLEKLAMLNMPDEVYNWLKNYFDGHSHSQFDLTNKCRHSSIYLPVSFRALVSALLPTLSVLLTYISHSWQQIR